MSEYSDYLDYLDSSGESYTSIRYWAEDVDLAMHTELSASSSCAREQESVARNGQASASDTEFDDLMEEYRVTREILEDIENRLLELYYDRLREESVLSTSSSQSYRSYSWEDNEADSGITIEGTHSQEPKSTSNVQSDKEHDQELTNPSKKEKTKQKKQKTEEQINRHINKVFMRENM